MRRLYLIFAIVAIMPAVVTSQTISVEDAEVYCSGSGDVAVTVRGTSEIDAFGFTLDFDPGCVAFEGLYPGSSTADWGAVEGVVNTTGVLTIGGFKAAGTPIIDFGELAVVGFSCVQEGACDCTSNLTIGNLVDDVAGATRSNGSITCTQTASSHSLKVRDYTFDFGDEGWHFLPTAGFNLPFYETRSGYHVISLQGDNSNTYGYFTAPDNGLPLGDYNPMDDSSQTGDLFERQGPHYLIRYWLRRTSVREHQAPSFRLRVNSANGEEFAALVSSTQGAFNNAPDLYKVTPVDFLFQPISTMYGIGAEDRYFKVFFDLFGFDPTKDPNGGYLIDQVQIWRIPLNNITSISQLKTYDFSTEEQRNEWFTTVIPSLAESPNFSTSNGRLEVSVPNAASSFGTWQNSVGTMTGTTPEDSDKLYLRLKTRLSSEEAEPYKVPLLRTRLMPNDFVTVAEHGLAGLATGTIVPSLGNDRFVYNYIEIKPGQLEHNILAALDVMSFEGDGTPSNEKTSSAIVGTELMEVDIVSIIDYPPLIQSSP